jgi:hypothetical protein
MLPAANIAHSGTYPVIIAATSLDPLGECRPMATSSPAESFTAPYLLHPIDKRAVLPLAYVLEQQGTLVGDFSEMPRQCLADGHGRNRGFGMAANATNLA